MKNRGRVVLIAAVSSVMIAACTTEPERNATKETKLATEIAHQRPTKTGEELYKQYCATCHPDGSNVSDPRRNLLRSTLQGNHITKPEDIIRIMRHPISRMITFDQSTLSDRDARAIAEYILKAF